MVGPVGYRDQEAVIHRLLDRLHLGEVLVEREAGLRRTERQNVAQRRAGDRVAVAQRLGHLGVDVVGVCVVRDVDAGVAHRVESLEGRL